MALHEASPGSECSDFGPAYIVGVEDNYRGAPLEAQLIYRHIAFQRRWGVDGRNWTPLEMERRADQRAARLLLHRPLTAGEIGCAASHRALQRELGRHAAAGQWPLVLEDDAELAPSFNHLGKAVAALQIDEPAVLVLHSQPDFTVLREGNITLLEDGLVLARCAIPPLLTLGYLPNAAALSLISARSRGAIDYVADWPPAWAYEVAFFICYPWMVRPRKEVASMLEPERTAESDHPESKAAWARRRITAVLGLTLLSHPELYPSLGVYLRHELVRPVRLRQAHRFGRRLWGRPDAPLVV